jgi:hypothetical protein
MPTLLSRAGDVFETGCDLMEATSSYRPDTGWRVVDAQGHEHRWYVDGAPAVSYHPSAKHETPTLVWIFERWGYYEDGERYAIGHHECHACGEPIEPRFTADTTRQYVPGLRWFRINGESVSPEEFERRVHEARL